MILSLAHPYQIMVASYLNMAFLATTLFILLFLIKQTIRDAKLQIACLLGVSLGLPTIVLHVFLWSEPLFLSLFSVLLFLLFKACQRFTIWHWVALVLVSAALCLQRYSGIFLVGGVALGLLLVNFNPKQALKVSIYVVCSLIPVVIYVLWTQPAAPSESEFGITFFGKNLISHYFLDTAIAWFVPHFLITSFSKWLFVGVLIVVLSILIWKLRFWNSLSPFYKITALVILVYFFLLSSLQLPLSEESVRYSLLMDVERYMAIIYPACMLLLFSGIDNQSKRLGKKSIIYLLLAIWLCYPIARTVKNVSLWHESNCTKTI